MSEIKKIESLTQIELKTIRIIDIENQDLNLFWELIFKCENLEEIYLTNCNLAEIPDELLKLPKLRIAEFRKNKIKNIDFKLIKSVELRSLNLDDNQLEELSEDANLIFWERLSMANNKINRLPEKIGKLSAVNFLNFENNKIQSLPNYFNENVFSNLQYLFLGNNELEVIPSKIGGNHNHSLKALHIQSNKIKSLPKDLEGGKKVYSFIASFNQLDQIPECVRSMKELDLLYLSYNQINEISEWIKELVLLSDFDLGGNPLEEANLTPIFGIESLEILKLYECNLTILPTSIGKCKNLIELDLTGNNLTFLPKEIESLEHLEVLKLGWNQLEDLPKEILGLKNLSYIDLTGNPNLNQKTKMDLISFFEGVLLID